MSIIAPNSLMYTNRHKQLQENLTNVSAIFSFNENNKEKSLKGKSIEELLNCGIPKEMIEKWTALYGGGDNK